MGSVPNTTRMGAIMSAIAIIRGSTKRILKARQKALLRLRSGRQHRFGTLYREISSAYSNEYIIMVNGTVMMRNRTINRLGMREYFSLGHTLNMLRCEYISYMQHQQKSIPHLGHLTSEHPWSLETRMWQLGQFLMSAKNLYIWNLLSY
jgi:hypothetical protein